MICPTFCPTHSCKITLEYYLIEVRWMKVLQRKILILVVSSILISALFIMSIAFLNYERILESDSRQIMQLMCSEKRQTIDEKLLNIKQSVHTLYHFAAE